MKYLQSSEIASLLAIHLLVYTVVIARDTVRISY